MDQLDELLTCRLDFGTRVVEPCSIIIFGASGDLTSRKLIPAFYHLFIGKQMPKPFRVIGVARREKTTDAWREELKGALQQFSRTQPPLEDVTWEAFASNVDYCQGDFSDPASYIRLRDLLNEQSHEGLRKNLL